MKHRSAGGAEVVAHGQSHGLPQTPAAPARSPQATPSCRVTVQQKRDKVTTMNKFPEYKTVSTTDLIPYARNSRTHSDAQVAKLAASIREFGFLNPIITDGANGIVAGHGRVLAAQKLGLEALPCIETDMTHICPKCGFEFDG